MLFAPMIYCKCSIPIPFDDLSKVHRVMIKGLVSGAEVFQHQRVGVYPRGPLIHSGTPVQYVPETMQQLFEWLQNTQAHPFISSSAFHYEFLSRMATEEPVVVASTGPLFYLIPVVYDRRLFYRDGSRSSHICRLSQ